ncbi:lamin tail domain-containing protein [candidate division KSB1 bacterium]|nr:lamin tail domain-containing protein [candidate division KSB1 bacterium]
MKAIALCMLFVLCAQSWGQHSAPNYVCINEIKTVGVNGYLDEYVELFNVSDSLFDLGGYCLTYFRRDGLALPESLTTLPDGKLYRVLYLFPDSTFIEPFHYFLLSTKECSELKKPDAVMKNNLLSNGQIILMNIDKKDTLDAVSWGQIDSVLTNEGLPAKYLEPIIGPPVSPELWPDPQWSIQRNPEGMDTNDNFVDFEMRDFTTPMNSEDVLKLVLDNSVQAEYLEKDRINVKWKTLSVTKNLSFEILYRCAEAPDWHCLDTSSSLIHEVKKDTNIFSYSFYFDSSQKIQSICLKENDFSHQARFSIAVNVDLDKSIEAAAPQLFQLGQNYPNPFNPVTTIPYRIITPNTLSIKIYNLAGKEIKTLFSGYRSSGAYTVEWDKTDGQGQKVPSGTYFYVLNYGHQERQVKKMIVLN